MKYSYDPVADAANITIKKGSVARTEEVSPGVMLDFDKKGDLLSLEILDASKRGRGLREMTFQPTRYIRK